jgi:HlyD family secretion protein
MTTTALSAPLPARSKKRRRRWVRRAAAGAFVAVVAVLLVMAWIPKPIAVETGRVARGPMVVTVDENAKTRVRDRFVVGAPLGGDLLRVELAVGDRVAQGAVLARIVPVASPLLDPRSRMQAGSRLAAARAAQKQAGAAKERAAVALEHARKEGNDARRLVASGAITAAAARNTELEERLRAQELESARFSVQVADNEVALARAALERFEPAEAGQELDVTAPADGVVLRVLRESAGVIQPGAPILEIGDPRNLEVVCDVLTSDAVAIRPGAKVTFERWGGARPLEGHVRIVEPEAFTRVSALGVEEQRAPVIIDLDTPEAERGNLGDAYRLDAHIVVWEHPEVLTAPSSAVFRARGSWAAYLVRGRRARLVELEVGRRNETQVEITSGLAAGDVVVVHPSDRLTDGARVSTR